MLNLNSPTVQAMISASPNMLNNVPVYYGNTPTVQTTMSATPQPQQQFQSPYPSPKDMLSQQGQQTIYQQTSFAPNPTPYPPNTVGMANPVYNPYQGYMYQQPQQYAQPQYYQQPQYYNRYNPQPQQPISEEQKRRELIYRQQFCPPVGDEDAHITWESANMHGMTYEEQVRLDSKVLKCMSRIVSKNLGRSEEEAERCEAHFDVFDKNDMQRETQEYISNKPPKPRAVFKVRVTCGDMVIRDTISEDSKDKPLTDAEVKKLSENNEAIVIVDKISEARQIQRDHAFRIIHNQAVERKYDNMDLLEFFNVGSSEITRAIQDKELKEYNNSLVGKVYDKNSFRNRLLANNGFRTREELGAVKRFVGRYGYLPNGMPISPQHDPGLSECFSYNAETGNIDITLPGYMSKAFEGARSRFLRSLDDT